MIQCKTPYCINYVKKGRKTCSSCVGKKTREKHPLKYAYTALRTNAKRRGKEFTLTFEEFKEFVIKTDYMAKKGIYKTSFHIDREKEHLGYTKNNIQALTNSENVKKYLEYYWNEEEKKMHYTTVTHKSNNKKDPNDPF